MDKSNGTRPDRAAGDRAIAAGLLGGTSEAAIAAMDAISAVSEALDHGATSPLDDGFAPSGWVTGTEPPLDALNEEIAAAVRAVARIIRVPEAMALQSALATINLPAQRLANVRIPVRHGAVLPTTLFLLTQADSGDRKTTTDRTVGLPLRDYEATLRDDYRRAMALRQDALQRAGKDPGVTVPPLPLKPNILIEEGTLDGILKLIARGQPSMGLYSDEGAQLLHSHSMQEDQKARFFATLSKFWDGSPISRVRAAEDVAEIEGRRLSVHLMVQPTVATRLLADEIADGQGFLARFLIVAPETLKGTRLLDESEIIAAGDAPSHAVDPDIAAFHERVRLMLAAPLLRVPGADGQVAPRTMSCERDAAIEWMRFFNEVEARMKPGGPLARLHRFASKLAEHALRLAANLALFEDPMTDLLGVRCMRGGIALAQFYLAEAVRLRSLAAEAPAAADAELLLAWLTGDWIRSASPEGFISISDVKQRGPAALRPGDRAAKAIDRLVRDGRLRACEGPVEILGKRRGTAWQIVRVN